MKSVTFENLKKQNYTMKESLRALKTNIDSAEMISAPSL